MNKKILLGVGSVLVLIAIAYLVSLNKPVYEANQAQLESERYGIQSNNEIPAIEENVTGQPAYLIGAYSKDGKSYIDVDYVEWLHGEASLRAQVEDGTCVNLIECHDYPNGYKRNQNPKIRTFGIYTLVSIEVNGSIASEINDIDQTQLENPFGNRLMISFKKLEDTVSKMESYYETAIGFKQPKAFITIDVRNNLVTKIVEPYQE